MPFPLTAAHRRSLIVAFTVVVCQNHILLSHLLTLSFTYSWVYATLCLLVKKATTRLSVNYPPSGQYPSNLRLLWTSTRRKTPDPSFILQ